MKHNDDILIDLFLRGELAEEELLAFQKRLQKEHDLREKFEEMKDIVAGIKESVLKEKKGLLEKFEEEISSTASSIKYQGINNSSEKSSKKSVSMTLWWVVAASSILIVSILFWPEEKVNLTSEYTALLEEEFETLIKHETMRSSEFEDPYTSEQRIAYDYFASEEFEKAIPLLKELWEQHQDSLARDYLGYSLLFSGKTLEGEKLLNSRN